MWWTISSAWRGSPRFLVVSVFLFVTPLCKQWKAEHVTMKAISWLLLCPLKMVVFLHPLSKLRLVLEWAWEGERPSNPNMTGQVQSHSCACKPVPCKSLLPSSNVFFMSSQGTGGEAGFTMVHPGLPRDGSDLSSSQVEVAFMCHVRRCWTWLALGRHILSLLPAQRREEAPGAEASCQLSPQLQWQAVLLEEVKSQPALGSPYWPG